MQDLGIVGAGGAGFPSYAKLAEGANLLLINGSECEPLLYTDYVILGRELETVLSGVNLVLDATAIPRALVCIKEHTAERLGFSEGERLSERVFVKVLPNVYPIGDEIGLIYEASGRRVDPGKLPITAGVIVYNVETMYNLGRGARFSEPVVEKWVTFGGNGVASTVVKVPVGAKVSDIFRKLGITVPAFNSVLDGGPSMGKLINPETAVITKTTKAILILPDETQAIASKKINEKMAVSRAETACCQCTRCTDLCPRNLLGYPLEPHKMVRTAMGAAEVKPIMVLSATLCCGCGVCESLACSQGISPRAVIANYKAVLAKNKMRFNQEVSSSVSEAREYRMIPSEKWAATLGVRKFDTVADFGGEISDFSRVEIPLSRHIGIPSVPAVEDGEIVSRGQIIASAQDGLSLPQHASISGRVTLGNGKIIIDVR